MKRVFLIHGWEGSVKRDFFPWLKTELKKMGYKVIAPEMPDASKPEILAWVNNLSKLVGQPDKETYFIGHSIGCQTILRYLETINTPIGGAIFVAGWFGLENIKEEGSEAVAIAKEWTGTSLNLEKVRQNLSKSALIISDNDPYGALKENKAGFQKIGSKIVLVPGGGHFTWSEGFDKLPIIIEELKNL